VEGEGASEVLAGAGSAAGGMAPEPTAPSLPRPLLWLGLPVAGVLLTAFFVFLQFPFDRFRETLADQAGRALGAEVLVGELAPAWGLAGPGLEAREVRVAWPDGERARATRVGVRPAWSLAWLRGRAALRLDAESDAGAAAGTLVLGEPAAWDGRVRDFDLERLPEGLLGPAGALSGRLDLDADLRLEPAGPVGEAHFEAREGSLQVPTLPFALPYTALEGTLRFHEDGSFEVEDVVLDGPMVSARLSGGGAAASSLSRAPLDLDLHLEVRDRNLRPALQNAGLRLRPDGTMDVKVRGTVASPLVR